MFMLMNIKYAYGLYRQNINDHSEKDVIDFIIGYILI